jgi:hypothetical protein
MRNRAPESPVCARKGIQAAVPFPNGQGKLVHILVHTRVTNRRTQSQLERRETLGKHNKMVVGRIR